MYMDWDNEPDSCMQRLESNFTHNGVNGIYDKESNDSYRHVSGLIADEAGIATLTSFMAEVMPSIVGDGKQSVAHSTAVNHIIVIPVDCGCIDSGITAGEYFGDIAETNTHLTNYAATNGGRILVVLITECGSTSCGNSVCCGCSSAGVRGGAPTLNICNDGSTARDGNLPASAPSSNIKVVLDAHSSNNCGCGSTYYTSSSCNSTDAVADFSDLSEYDLSDGNEWTCFQACAYRVIREWMTATFDGGMPQDNSTMVHAMAGCRGGSYGLSGQSELAFAWIVKNWADNFLGEANGGNGMSWEHDSFNYPLANWIDMMNLALRNITGHGEQA